MLLGEDGTLDQGGVLEIHVTGVHDPVAIALHGDGGGAEDMAGIVEGGADLAGRIEVEGALEIPCFEGALDFIDVPVGKEGILGDAKFRPLRLHHIHGIVEHGGGELRGCRGKEGLRLGLAMQEHRQGADVIEVGVGHDHGIDRAILQQVVAGNAFQAIVLRVKPGIENYAGASGIQKVRIGADFGVAAKATKQHET